ncbi:MAG: alpha/beta hydrolase [Thermoanaerobaculales bacterium]|nr:alpha/beta hydrolase [Thermoanaerobaculales bacterium]
MSDIADSAWRNLGGDGPPLVLTHANGFPPETYRVLLEALEQTFRVATFAHRPLWSRDDPAALESWHPMADDLIRSLQDRGGPPVTAVGHSLGGVLCALAAARRPELFAALVLLDPVIFTGFRSFFWGWTKRLGQDHRFFLAKGAARRRDRWPDRESHRASWSGKAVFASWDPRVVEDYLAAGVVDDPDGGVRLRYPKAWETRIFRICPHDEWAQLKRIETPTLVIRGETSDTLLPAAARRMAHDMPDATAIELAGTSHFLPMEKPEEVARLIADFASIG